MANTGFKGIDIRQTGNQLVFRALLQDAAGAILTSGTTSLRIYELQSDGTLKSYDFNDNTFKIGALTTETQALTHRQGNNSTTNTGLWTTVLSTLTGFTAGALCIAHITNTGASPAVQAREFQYGSAEGDLVTTANGTGVAELNADVAMWRTKAVPAANVDGVPLVDLKYILGTLLTETAGQIAGAFKKFFNVATPTGTVNSLPGAVAGANGGLPIVGANHGDFAFTGDWEMFNFNVDNTANGDFSGVTVGAVAQVGVVTGDVNGKVLGGGSGVITDIGVQASLAASAVQAIWDAATSGLTTAGSIGKFIVETLLGYILLIKARTDMITGGTSLEISGATGGTSFWIKRGDTINSGMVNNDLATGLDEYWFTVKRTLDDDDTAAILQLNTVDGLVYVNGQAVADAGFDAADGAIAITLDGSDSNFQLHLTAAVCAALPVGTYYWDVQGYFAAGPNLLTYIEGLMEVRADVTRAVPT